jgi:hypothetical protein
MNSILKPIDEMGVKTPTTKPKLENELSNVPSTLIREALYDLELCEISGYRINMNTWNSWMDGVCNVCLAGSVMAATLKLPPGSYSEGPATRDVSRSNVSKLYALNAFRVGKVFDGLTFMKKELPIGFAEKVKITPYGGDGASFKSDMKKLANSLEKAGL